MSANLFDRLRTGGIAIIHQMVADAAEETLHVEFKELTNPSTPNLVKDDKRLIAKALCGMANAEGGVLIIGVRSGKKDGVDVAVELKSVAFADVLRRRITAAIPEMLSFQHTGIEAIALTSSKDECGVIAVNVPPSDRRPHMSVPHWSYFRRGSDGTRSMTNGEVRELILAQQLGSMRPKFTVAATSAHGYTRLLANIQISLENDGKIPLWAPYVIIRCVDRGPAAHSMDFAMRRSTDGSVGIYSSRDAMIPPTVDMIMATIPTGLLVHESIPIQLSEAREAIARNPQMALINHLNQDFTQAAPEVNLELSIRYGAANAAQNDVKFDLTREDLLHELLKARSLILGGAAALH